MQSQAKVAALRFARRGVFSIAGPGKENSGGEDAYFATSQALGVSDGVGSWGDHGVDPAQYARKLMSGCLQASKKTSQALKNVAEFIPMALLKEGYDGTRVARVEGSATAIVAAMIDDRKLGVVNVGDSGLRIIRNGDLLYGTAEGTYSFNFPYQLGPSSDFRPEQGECSVITLHRGDVLVLASDGLLDNLFDGDIVKIVAPLCGAAGNTSAQPSASISSTEPTPSTIAELLAKEAFRVSRNRSSKTPFGTRAAAYTGEQYVGGKPDDITVLVAVADEIVNAALPFATELDLSEESKVCPLLIEDFYRSIGKKLVAPSHIKSPSSYFRSRL
jgi:serine/threonine protein phosphatase PrpC